MDKKTVDIVDIFSSIQGEGLYVGTKQIFVRFKDCNLSCSYCDEDLRDRSPKDYTPLELISEIKRLNKICGPHHSVSFTGGEPLLYAEFLKTPLKILREEKLKSYLETNGTLSRELRGIIDLIDIIAMDLKMPSSTGGEKHWKEHLRFLKIAAKKNVFVKVVVTSHTQINDLKKAVALVRTISKNIPLILQPATPRGTDEEVVSIDTLITFLTLGSKRRLKDVRIIPQMHRMLGVK